MVLAAAAIILIAGLTSPWWLPLLRPEAGVTAQASPDESGLSDRIARLETAVGALRAAPPAAQPTEDLDQIRASIAALGHRVDAGAARSSVDPQAFASLAESVEDLKSRLTHVETELSQRQTATRDGRALVLGALDIEAALAGSTQYQAAIDLLRPAAEDDLAIKADLDTLERSAKTGLPSRVKLAQDLAALPGQLSAEPEKAPENAGFWQRATNRLVGLVRIRRVEEDGTRPAGPPGPDRIVADAEAMLAAGDLAGAIEAVKGLDGRAAELASPWLTQATQRLAAERAAHSLAGMLAKRVAQRDHD
jgi:hypothetical protein